MGPSNIAVATYVRAILLARNKGLFLTVTPIPPAKEAAHHRGVGFDPSLGQRPIFELKSDVRFLGPRGFQKITVRHLLAGAIAALSDRLSRTMAFKALRAVATDSLTSCDGPLPRIQLAPLHRLDHPVAQVLRIRLCHSGWPPPSRQVESKSL